MIINKDIMFDQISLIHKKLKETPREVSSKLERVQEEVEFSLKDSHVRLIVSITKHSSF